MDPHGAGLTEVVSRDPKLHSSARESHSSSPLSPVPNPCSLHFTDKRSGTPGLSGVPRTQSDDQGSEKVTVGILHWTGEPVLGREGAGDFPDTERQVTRAGTLKGIMARSKRFGPGPLETLPKQQRWLGASVGGQESSSRPRLKGGQCQNRLERSL